MSRPTFRQRVATLVATLGGLGRAPVAPGTVGSLVGAGLVWLLPLEPSVQLAALAGVAALGVWSAGVSARQRLDADPSVVVIDEVAGMLVAGFLLPKRFGLLLAAFLLFRVFDIGKWSPMKQLERLPGGWGIMADDLAAGICSRLALWLMAKI